MIVKTIHEITNMMHATLHGDIDDTKKIHGVVIDSRQVTKDVLYVPIIGQRVDGHTFAKQTIEDGALISLWQKDHVPYPDFPVILVDDTLKAMQDLSKAYLDELHPLVIGVTGSNGKTSCKDILYSIFSQEKKTQKTQGNRNSEIGLPLTIFDFDKDIEVAILEMGMENKGEITQLTSIAQPDISVITSIGSAHMENLGGKLQIAQAKCEILEGTKENGLFLYNYESKEIQEVLCTLDTLIHFVPEVSATAKFLSGWCETIALAAIGLRLNLVEFIKAGKKLLIYGLSTLVFQVVLALILISLLIK